MGRKENSRAIFAIITVPLIVCIILAVFMAAVTIRRWRGGVQVTFSWQSEEVAQLKDKLQSSFDALKDRLEEFRKKLAELIEEYK